MKEDSQINLLSNLSSFRGGKQSAATASFSGPDRGSFSSSSRGSSRGGRVAKRSFSSSLLADLRCLSIPVFFVLLLLRSLTN